MSAVPIDLRGLAAAGLAVDAGIHVAHRYAPVTSSTISEATLFRLEAVAAILALLLGVFWRRRVGDAFAWLAAAAGLAAFLLYAMPIPGSPGPLPDMYEPIWFAERTWA